MSIVPQSPVVSHSPFLMLAAPRIAGLLPARVPERRTFRAGLTPDQELFLKDDILSMLRTPDEMDADLYDFMVAQRERYNAVVEKYMSVGRRRLERGA